MCDTLSNMELPINFLHKDELSMIVQFVHHSRSSVARHFVQYAHNNHVERQKHIQALSKEGRD